MQLNKIRKQTFAAFESSSAHSVNEFMQNFKRHLEQRLQLDKVTIMGMSSSSKDNQSVMTIYYAYITPDVKKKKEKKGNTDKKTEKKDKLVKNVEKKKKNEAATV